MARLLSITPAGTPVHVMQRGNKHQVCFASNDDHVAYTGWLKKYSQKCEVAIHAWVQITNHVHLLCTPRRDGAVSKMRQGVERRYVQYFNYQYQRSGTLW